MNKLQDLRNLVDKLEAKTYSKEIVQTLQEIGAKLINEYDIKVGNLTIEPLLVEAYYYNCDKLHGFQDENCHRQPEQRGQEHFGTLYFHKKDTAALICAYHVAIIIFPFCSNALA